MSLTYSVTKAITGETLHLAQQLGFCLDKPDRQLIYSTANVDRVPVSDLLELLRCIRKQMSDADVALRIGQLLPMSCFTLVGYLVMCGQTMRESLPYAEKFHCLVLDIGSFSIHLDEGDVVIEWQLTSDFIAQERLIIDLMMAAMRRFGIWITGESKGVKEVQFQYEKPASLSCLKEIFPCSLKFGQNKNSFRLPEAYLDIPIRSADKSLCPLLYSHAINSMKLLHDQNNCIESVKHALVPLLAGGSYGIDTVAKRLNMSARSLQRRLSREGISYKQLLKDVRLQQANFQLHNTQSSLSDIASMLGYSEQSSFSNAYKSWTGYPPITRRKCDTER